MTERTWQSIHTIDWINASICSTIQHLWISCIVLCDWFFFSPPLQGPHKCPMEYYGTTSNLDEHREYVDGCPAVANKYTITPKYGKVAKNTTRQWGIHGLCEGFPRNQQVWFVYLPSSCITAVSCDVESRSVIYMETILKYTSPASCILLTTPSPSPKMLLRGQVVQKCTSSSCEEGIKLMYDTSSTDLQMHKTSQSMDGFDTWGRRIAIWHT
jgi:hypothetical protein